MNPLVPAWILLANLALMLGGWMACRRVRNAGVAHLLWSISLCASAVYLGMSAHGSPTAQMLVVVMGGLWGSRLFLHLLGRILTEREDARYRHLREMRSGGDVSFLPLFLRCAVSATLYALPLYVAANNPQAGSSPWTLLAATVYLVGLSGEAYADRQLAHFRSNPRHLGHTCRRGLWRYSRHPNYFFSAVHWSSYALLAVGVPWSWWSLTLLAPVLTILGWIPSIRANEAQAVRTRGQDYRDYQTVTSMLVPWFPRGWPNEQPDTSSWQTPLPLSRRGPRTLARPTLETLERRETPSLQEARFPADS